MAISRAEIDSAGSQTPPVTGENSLTRTNPSIDSLTAKQIHDAILDRDVNRAHEVLDKLKGIMPEEQARLAAFGSNKSDEVLFSAEDNSNSKIHTIVDFTSEKNTYFPRMDYQT